MKALYYKIQEAEYQAHVDLSRLFNAEYQQTLEGYEAVLPTLDEQATTFWALEQSKRMCDLGNQTAWEEFLLEHVECYSNPPVRIEAQVKYLDEISQALGALTPRVLAQAQADAAAYGEIKRLNISLEDLENCSRTLPLLHSFKQAQLAMNGYARRETALGFGFYHFMTDQDESVEDTNFFTNHVARQRMQTVLNTSLSVELHHYDSALLISAARGFVSERYQGKGFDDQIQAFVRASKCIPDHHVSAITLGLRLPKEQKGIKLK